MPVPSHWHLKIGEKVRLELLLVELHELRPGPAKYIVSLARSLHLEQLLSENAERSNRPSLFGHSVFPLNSSTRWMELLSSCSIKFNMNKKVTPVFFLWFLFGLHEKSFLGKSVFFHIGKIVIPCVEFHFSNSGKMCPFKLKGTWKIANTRLFLFCNFSTF